jgi:hypothetical protein
MGLFRTRISISRAAESTASLAELGIYPRSSSLFAPYYWFATREKACILNNYKRKMEDLPDEPLASKRRNIRHTNQNHP